MITIKITFITTEQSAGKSVVCDCDSYEIKDGFIKVTNIKKSETLTACKEFLISTSQIRFIEIL